jgi:thymidylate kinase
MFQGKILDVYEGLREQFKFTVIDATREIHDQQSEVRGIISERINLPTFRM